MDLGALDRAVGQRQARWSASGIAWEIIRSPVTDKPAAALRAESASATAELILWVSGEADMTYAPLPVTDEPVSDHYELTSAVGLEGCLDDFEHHLGIV